MKIQSCNNCGTVLDMDKIEPIQIPNEDYDPTDEYIEDKIISKQTWDRDIQDMVDLFECPVCKSEQKMVD